MRLNHQMMGIGSHRGLALHGWFGHERFLDARLPALDLDRFTLCCLAYQGYGASMDLCGQYTLDEIAADSLDTADAAGWRQFNVLGHSMGAKAALKVLLRAPAGVQRIVALTPMPANAVPFDETGWNLFGSAATDKIKRQAIIDHSWSDPAPQSPIHRQHLLRRNRSLNAVEPYQAKDPP